MTTLWAIVPQGGGAPPAQAKSRAGEGGHSPRHTAQQGPGTPDRPHHGPEHGRRSGDKGQVAVEYLGILPILLIVALLLAQLGIAVYAVQQAGTAARAAARVASLKNPGTSYVNAGQEAASDWLHTDIHQDGGGIDSVTITAEVEIPSIVPGLGLGTASRSVTMPRD